MGNVRTSQVAALPVDSVTSPNNVVEWQDQDIADAFVEKGKSHGVTISPDTAMELANQVRGKVKKNDVLELHAVVKEIIDSLFPNNPEGSATKASLDILSIVSKRIEKYKRVFAQEGNGPIGADEEEELRAGVLNDVIMPLQDGIEEKAADATRKLMRELLPLQQSKNEIEAFLGDDAKVKALYEDLKNNPKDNAKKKLYKAETRIRDQKIRQALDLLNKINVIKSKLILLDRASGYLKKSLEVMDQYRGVDGMSRYFEKVLQPGIANIKDIIIKVRRGIVLPEVDAKTRHEREWIMRHHHTKSYQGGEIGPDVDNITLDEFKNSPVYKELQNRGIGDATIAASLEQLDSKPMTWRKGQAIYMLLDPPAEKTINKDIPTLMENTPEDVRNEEGKVVNKAWSSDIVTNQPFNIEKGKFEQQKDKMEKATNPRAMSKERKISEAANENAHWSVLFNLSRNQKVDASGKTRAEQYIESIPENLRNKKEVLENAAKMEEEDHLNDKEIIYSALWNPNTPDWVLMKAALTGYAETTRRIAKAILERKRGWQPKLDAEHRPMKDEETNDFIWERVPGFDAVASFDLKKVLAQNTTSTQQATGTQNAIQQQINAVDQQMKTNQEQMQQLQVRKTDLEKQRDSVKVPPATQPATGTPPPAQTGMPPAQPMAADGISFRKLSQLIAPTSGTPTAPSSPSQQQAISAQQSIDNQIETLDSQIQQMQIEKARLENEGASKRIPITQPSAPGNVPSTSNTGTSPAPVMASFKKADMYGLTELKPEDYAKDSVDDDLGVLDRSAEEEIETEDEFMEPTEPEEGDFVYDDATSGLSIVGDKYLGKFIEWDDVEKAIREYARKNQWFPNVWKMSDHGNAHLLQNFSYDAKPQAAPVPKDTRPWKPMDI